MPASGGASVAYGALERWKAARKKPVRCLGGEQQSEAAACSRGKPPDQRMVGAFDRRACGRGLYG